MGPRRCNACGRVGTDYYESQPTECRECRKKRRHEYHKTRAPGLRRARKLAQWSLKAPRPSAHTETVCAYAAGLVDGEGCIRINEGRSPAKTWLDGGSRYTALVEVANTDPRMIEFLRSRWGGHISNMRERADLNRRAAQRWTVVSEQVLPFLDDIFPFLIVKRTQAKLVRRYQRFVQYKGRHGPEALRVLPLQQRFYSMLRVLNRRGVHQKTE